MGGGKIPWKKALRNTWMAPLLQGMVCNFVSDEMYSMQVCIYWYNAQCSNDEYDLIIYLKNYNNYNDIDELNCIHVYWYTLCIIDK